MSSEWVQEMKSELAVCGVRACDSYIYNVHNRPNPDPESIHSNDYILLCK